MSQGSSQILDDYKAVYPEPEFDSRYRSGRMAEELEKLREENGSLKERLGNSRVMYLALEEKAGNEYAIVCHFKDRLEKAQAVIEAAKSAMWLNECRCDKAYTERHRHEPNSMCGEMDELNDALVAYDAYELVQKMIRPAIAKK